MINLSERLLTISNMINDGETVADIGTDHGYLPIYRLLNKKSPYAILTDVSGGSLSKARKNCEEFLLNEKYDLREGDGLEVLDSAEVDAVVMAGIGGLLIIDILDWDLEKSHSYKKLILQPRNNGGALREYLYKNGFLVNEFRIVPEGERFCEIMNVSTDDSYKTGKSNIEYDGVSLSEWEFPEEIISVNNPSGEAYLKKCLKQEEIILDKIIEGLNSKDKSAEENKSPNADKDIAYRRERIERIKELLLRL